MYPFSISSKELTLSGEVDVYLSEELYSNDRLFLKNVPETGAINVNSSSLSFLEINQETHLITFQKYTVFIKKKGFHSIDLKFSNFVTDFNFEIKKIFESTLNKEKTEIDVPPTIKEILESQMDKCNINILKKEIKTANACF